ncbi:hypothetical protein NW249_07840 [Streptomyces sp. OUCMDZ-4982]|uniref:hypothetical protein n=1 Tax=Streptomyces sp. OUCMDZ-4982 TaxID=2973090 RepID=UPI00215B77BA|nr:hypothetical protein [Streptomyces sp. OUCMDZ-4982]MCR8942030.1 hypothetical protein [Streptomyces sp. OUCMDZ-4982]
MDAGWAAVVAAGIAAIISGGGVVVGARMSTQGLRRQVQDQAATEHSHWLRDRRADACVRFLEQGAAALLVVDSAETSARNVSVPVGARSPERVALWEQARRELYGEVASSRSALSGKVAEIRLMAPRLAEAAANFEEEVLNYVEAVAEDLQHHFVPDSLPGYEYRDAEVWMRYREGLQTSLLHFADRAASVLAHPPAPPGSR